MSWRKKLVAVVIGVALFGAALYGAVYVLVRSSDAFAFAEQRIRTSSVIAGMVGNVKEIKLSPLGPFEQQTVNSDEWTLMTVEVEGSNRSIALQVKTRKVGGVLALDSVKYGNQVIDIQ